MLPAAWVVWSAGDAPHAPAAIGASFSHRTRRRWQEMRDGDGLLWLAVRAVVWQRVEGRHAEHRCPSGPNAACGATCSAQPDEWDCARALAPLACVEAGAEHAPSLTPSQPAPWGCSNLAAAAAPKDSTSALSSHRRRHTPGIAANSSTAAVRHVPRLLLRPGLAAVILGLRSRPRCNERIAHIEARITPALPHTPANAAVHHRRPGLAAQPAESAHRHAI